MAISPIVKFVTSCCQSIVQCEPNSNRTLLQIVVQCENNSDLTLLTIVQCKIVIKRNSGWPSHAHGWCSRWVWSRSCPEDPPQSPQWCKPSVPYEQAETSLPSEELCLFWSKDVWISDSCPEWLPEILCLQLKHDYWGKETDKWNGIIWLRINKM